MPFRKPDKPSDQNNFLGIGEAGVCNALVLQWLGGAGVPMRLGRGRGGHGNKAVQQAVTVHRDGVRSGTFSEYFLRVTEKDMFHYTDEQTIVGFLAAAGMYLIGFSHATSGEGHAVGTINSGGVLRAYDPNEGFWTLANANEYEEWVRDRLDNYCLLYDFFDVCLYRAVKNDAAVLSTVFGR
jgi:hypothetical protein